MWIPTISKNKVFLFFKREETGLNHDVNKAKPNSDIANNSMLNIWDSLTVLWPPPRGLGYLPGSALSTAHADCLIGSSWLHFIADGVPGGHHMAPASSKELRSPVATGLHLHHQPALGSPPEMPVLPHSATPQMFSITPSCL